MFYSFSQQLNCNLNTIENHWQSGIHKKLSGINGELFYTIHEPKKINYAVILVAGRIESSHKYRELIWELTQNNVAVYCCDHIGQGQSERLISNPQIGFIESFSDFSDDLNVFIKNIVIPRINVDYYFLAHSMGGAICWDYLARYSTQARGAFITAPMLGINTKPFSKKMALRIASLACSLGFSRYFAFGQKEYQDIAFIKNNLTNCHVRYTQFRTLYDKHTYLQLGGVSFAWLKAALNWTTTLPLLQSQIPMHITLAEQDSIVDNEITRNYAAKYNNMTVSEIPTAKHELLNEQDTARQILMREFYDFCNSLRSSIATGS